MPFAVPRKPPFAPKKVLRFSDLSMGLNNKFSALSIDPKEVSDIQNMNYDEKGSLKKRKGYLKHYASSFDGSPARDMFNYRKQDGTSRLVIAAGTSLYYDRPQFTQSYIAQGDWEVSGASRDRIDTTTTPGSIWVMKGLGTLGNWALGGRWGTLGGGAKTLPTAIWRSQPLDITAVSDKTTGKAIAASSVPVGATAVVETRVSNDQISWTAWTGLGAGNSIQSVGANNFLEVRVRFTLTSRGRPSVSSLTVTFDVTPTVTSLATGLDGLARYTFATQNDILYIVNGVDANRRWDGTTFTTQGGSAPICKFVVVHKNIMFLAGNSTNRSRLYFSAIGDPETWPALNFIDVGKGDGDTITGLAILLDQLIITKQHSIWTLQGDSSSTFILRRTTDEAGCVDMHSIVVVKNTLGLMAPDGFYFFDGVRMALASEKIISTINGLNSAQFGLVSASYFPQIRKIFISLPEGSAVANNVVLVFDTLRTCWTVYRGISAASWVIWRQFNTDHLLFGSSSQGQIYDAETGYSDDGSSISCYVVTKADALGGSEIEKLTTQCLVDAKETTGTGNATINISFFKDLNTTESTASAKTITGSQVNTVRVIPSAVAVSSVREIAMKVSESSANRSITLYGITLEYTPKIGLRAT